MATPLRSPYEPAEEIPLDDSRYLLHDADTVYSANPRVGYRLSGFNANEEFNPAKGTPRQVMAREATEAAAKYLNEHGGFQPNVVGRDTTGSRNVSENPDLADYMVRNLYADPAVGFKNQSPALQQRVRDASEQAKLTMLFDQNNPVANQWRNLPERDYVNDPLPTPNRRPMSTGQALLNAIPRGVDVLQGDLFGAGHALARAVDKVPGFEGKNANTLRIMEEGVKRNEEEAALNPAKYGSYKDVKGVGDVLPFMAEKAVESLPSMLPMAAGGILGAAARGSTVLGALTAGAGRKAAEEAVIGGMGGVAKVSAVAAKEAAETAARATIGATALGAVPHAGEIEQEQMKLKDPAPVWQVAGGALINSALDTFGVMKGLDQFLGASKAKGVLDVAKQLAQSLGVTSVTEGATEGLQQLTNIALRSMHDPDYNPLTNPKDRASAVQELAEAGIGGAAAGGLMGGLGRASGMVRQSLVDQPTTENRTNELPQSNSEQNPIQDPTGDEAITAPPLATETNAQSGLPEMPATPPPTVDAVGGEVATGVDDLWAEAQQLDARAGDQQSEASLDKYFQEVNESYPNASEALKQQMAISLRIIEESNDTDSDEYKQSVNALNQATNELDKNAPEINPIDHANSKGDDYKLGLIHLYNESLKTLAYNRSRVQRVTDSGISLSNDALVDIEESNRNAEEAIANVQSQFTPEELKTRHTKYRDDLWNSLSKSSLSGQDRDQISEVNEKFVESLKGKSPDQLKRIAQEKRRRADNTIGLNGGRHNRLSSAQLSEAMYAERLADELNTTSTAPIVPTDNVQGLAPDAADNGVDAEKLAPDSLSVTSTPDATGNLGNVTERDGTVDSELSAESSVEDTATRSNAQGTIVDGKITLGQASTSSVSAEQQGNKEAPISAKLANIPITADGQQIPGTGQHVDRPTNQDKLSVEAASIDKVLESAKKSGRLDASDLAAVFDSHPQLLKNFHNFLQRTEPGTKPGYTKNGTPIYEKPFNVLKVLREAAKGNPEAAKVLTKMHEELKGFSAEIQALKDFADNAPMLGKSREMTDESERSDDEGADNAIGDLTIDNRYGTQNARVFDPNESTGVIYHGARTSNESLGKVRGYVADSPAIFPRLRSVSGLPEVIPDGKGNYVAGREGQTADEVRKQNKYFELVKTGDYWHVHEVTKDDVGESIAPNVIREKVRNAITNVSGNASTGKSGTAQNAKLSLTRMTPLKRKIKGEVKETSDVFIDATHLTRLGATLNRQDASKSPLLKDYFDNFATAVAVLYDQNIFADDGFTVSSIPHDLVIAYDRTVVNGVEKSTPVTYGEAFAAQRESDYTWDKYGDGAYAMFMDSPYRGATSAYDEQTGETLKVVGEEYSPDMQQDGVEREDIKASMKERDKALRQEVAQKETTEPTATYFEPSGKSYVEDGRLSKFVHDIAAKLGIKAKFHVVDESGVTGLLAHLNALQANLMDTMDLKQDVLDEVRHMRNVVLDTIGGKSMAHFRHELEQEAAHTNPGVQALAEALKFVSNKDLATEENAEKVYSILGKFEKDYRVSHAQLKDRLLALRATMKALREAKSSKIIYNDTSPIAIEREPIIFISNLDVRGKPKKLARQINEAAHELGHLIKRVAVDQLIEKAKRGDTEADAVVKAIFGSVDWNNESEALLADERFAEMTRKWSLTHAVPKNAVDRFFKDIGNVMRKLYNFAKSMFTKAEDRSQFESFERFMEAMLDRSGIVRSNMESAQKEVALAQRDNSRGYNGNLGPNERWAKDAADARFANATKRAVAPTWEAANLHKANTYVTGTAKTYADFVNDLVLSEFAPQNKKGVKSHNYTPQESLDDVQKYAKRAATWSKDKPVLGTVTKTLGGIADIMKLVAPHVRAVVPVMQDIAPHWGEIGGHWVTLPGTKPLTKMWRVRIENGKITKESRDFVPIHIEIGKIRNGILKDNKSLVEIMSDVLAALPKVEGLAWMKSAQRKQVAERYEGMARDLLKFTTNQIPYSALSEEAKAVADYFKLLNDVFARSSEYSVTFNKRDAYFPLRIDKDKWNQNSRPVIEALIKYGKYPVEAAEHLFNEIARSHGIVDESLVDEAILASGLTAKHGRKFPLELQKALLDLDVYSMDIHHIVQSYTHQIIKRAVEQSRFGDYKRDTKGTYIKDDNGHFIFDPMGQINHIMDVDRATYYQNNSKGVHPEKLDWLRTKAFPALRGTLGGTIDPKLNALMDWTMLALNFIMLPLSVTSQLPDLAGIANMRGRTLLQPREMLRDVIKVARYFTDKSERESLRRAAQVIGSIEPHLVSSILAESMADEYMTPSTKRLSEAFFEATQMKRFTDFSRVLSTRFAIDALNEYADKPTAAKTLKLLQELHLSPQALAAWDRAGRPTDVNSLMQHDQIRTALAQWNDMAILRPSAGMRPVIGSDVRAKLFWHLKNYLYAFYYMQMKRAWVNMKDESNFAAAVPAISLGAFAMGLALAGYELRKLLANEIIPELVGVDGKSKDEDAGDLVWESFDRSGLMGPFSIIHDMWSAEKRGQMAISSLMGPAFSKTVDFMDKDLPDFLAANIPVVAQSAPLRSAARRELGKYLPDQLIGED